MQLWKDLVNQHCPQNAIDLTLSDRKGAENGEQHGQSQPCVAAVAPPGALLGTYSEDGMKIVTLCKSHKSIWEKTNKHKELGIP